MKSTYNTETIFYYTLIVALVTHKCGCLDTPIYLEECPCIRGYGYPMEGISAPRLSTCYAYCVVKGCYALKYSAATYSCEIYNIESVGYTIGSVNNFDCDNNPSEPAGSSKKWYLRTSGSLADTQDCDSILTQYPSRTRGYNNDVTIRGFSLPSGKHYCLMDEVSLGYPITLGRVVGKGYTYWTDAAGTEYNRNGYFFRIQYNKCLVRAYNFEDPGKYSGDSYADVGGVSNFDVFGGGSCSDSVPGGLTFNIENMGYRLAAGLDFKCKYGVPQTDVQSNYSVDLKCVKLGSKCAESSMSETAEGGRFTHLPLLLDLNF